MAIPFVIVYRNKLHINVTMESVVSIYKKSMLMTHDLLEWIVRNAFGLISPRTPESEVTIHRASVIGTSLALYHSNDGAQSDQLYRRVLSPLAKIHWDVFFTIASSDTLKHTLWRENELTVNMDTPIIIVYDSLGIPFVMNQSYTLDTINQFIQHFKAAAVVSSLRCTSETTAAAAEYTKNIISQVNEYSPHVKYITETNIHSLVTFEKKPVLLTLYRITDDGKFIDLLTSLDSVRQSLVNRSSSSSSLSSLKVVSALLNVQCDFNSLPIELRYKCNTPVHVLIVEKGHRHLWKDVTRYKGHLSQGIDSLVDFVVEQVKRVSVKAVSERAKSRDKVNLSHVKYIDSRMKSEL